MLVIKNAHLRRTIKWSVPFAAIPLLVTLGALVLESKRHLLISFGVAALAFLLFLSGFEKKKTGARRLVIVSVMTALCIAGRFIPLFKPITALTIITAMYLGGEAGFLVGALAAVLSNFYFGQGPWTAFQMLAWGMLGLISGYLQKPLKKSRAFLLLFGVLSGIAYSLIMDVWTVLWCDGGFNGKLYLASVAAAIPHTVVYSISNFVFLWFLARPFGEKLERVRLKYGV